MAVLAGGGELFSTKGAIILGFFRCALSMNRKKKDSPVAKLIVPDLGIKLTPALGLSYRPARLHTVLAGRYDNPMPESTLSPSQGL
jgi:hypothetical protein